MPWFNVDDGFAFHRKAVRAGNSALGLWVRAGSWCAQQLTDGFVPEEMVEVLGTASQAQRLVAAGLWSKVEDGYVFHEWTDSGRNPSRSEVLLRRKKEAEKKARAREAKSTKTQANLDSPQGTASGHPGGLPEGVRSTPPLPSPPSKEDSLRSSSPRKRGHRLPGDFTVSAEMVSWARENAPDVDGRTATDAFKDHFRSAPGQKGVKLDWTATWRNWMRTEQQKIQRRRPSTANGYASQTDANIAALMGRNGTPNLLALPGGASS
jgi:hypothetical protein